MGSLLGLEPIPVSPYKQDPAWKHCQVFVKTEEAANGLVKVEVKKCLYCGKMFQGGGINRLKGHLAGRAGNGPICDQVPDHVRLAMLQNMDSCKRQKSGQLIGVPIAYYLENGEDAGGSSGSVDVDRRIRGAGFVDNVHLRSTGLPNSKFLVEEECGVSNVGVDRGKMLRDRNSSLANPGAGYPSSIIGEKAGSFAENTQSGLIAYLDSKFLVNQEKEVGVVNTTISGRKRLVDENSSDDADLGIISNDSGLERVDNKQIQAAIGRFLYEIGAPLDAVKDSVYLQPMIDAIVSGGSGTVAPSFHDLRGWILKDVVEEVKNDVGQSTTRWEKTGCSVLVSQWNSGTGKILLNFSVNCPKRTIFFKSVDVSNIIHSPDALYDLLKQVVVEVGVKKVLQVITSGEEQYVVAGKRLMDNFPTLYWSPCAARCIQLILEDFGNIQWIKSTVEQARSVTRYIYKHSVVLNIMRRYTFGIDIVKAGDSVFATNFMTLKQMADLKLNLQSMVTSTEWMGSQYSQTAEGFTLLDTLTNRSFWSSCILITHLTDPLLRVLRIVRSQKRPAMGYIFAGIYRAKERIKRELVKREHYMIYWNIIDSRWKTLWRLPLHMSGFYLNPKFFYSVEGDMHNSIMTGMFDCIERLVPDVEVQDKIIKEIKLYKHAAGDLGRTLAVRARDSLLPAEWWSTYGGCCPNLSRLAICILSQTCSLVHHKPNQVLFEQLHKTRNSLEHQRLNDLVFVQYNLQLKQRVHRSVEQEYADPISFDAASVVKDWITDKEICLEENVCPDWTSLEPPSVNSMLLELSTDEAEDFRAGFDDNEIFGVLTEVEVEVKVEEVNMM
ncbi:hypothetical protein UlMin_014056 [Ulmus minor]